MRIGPARAAARHTFFHPSAGGSSLLGRFLRRILAALANAFNLHSLALGHLLELGAIAALVIGAVALAARLAPRRRPAGRVAEAAAPQTVYAAARAAALGMADSDPREALRLLYAAALAELNRRRGWRPRPGRTNWGFVRALGGATPEAVALAECTQLFERAVYGHAPVAPDDVRRADGLAEAMLA
ncbi:MAG TPA: DUF4129 domain-containing protein [Gaiellales bacterium]